MKMISKVALTAALTIGTAATVATPALAQKNKKGDAAAAPQMQMSAEFRKLAIPVDAAAKAQNWAAVEQALPALDAAAKSDDEKYLVAAWRLPVVAQRNNPNELAPALDALLANPKTPQADLGKFNYVRGQVAVQLKKPAEAIPYLRKARDLGYQDSNLQLLLTQSLIDSGDVNGGVAELDKAIAAEKAAGRKAPEAWYNYGVSRLYKAGDRTATSTWLMREIADYPTPENWRKAILVYRDGLNAQKQQLPKNEKLDLYRLQRSVGALADANDYYDYANAAINSGLPWEAKAVIDEGRSNGKIPASEASTAQLYSAATKGIAAELPLATYETKAKAAAQGSTAAQTGDAYLASGNSAKAVELYRLALQKGGVNADEVNTRLGIALARGGDKAGAREAFAKVQGQPRSDIAKFWIASLNPAA